MNYNKNKYNEFNNILSGCKTIIDAYYFGDLYIKYNPEMNTMVKSMIHGKKYNNVLSFNNIKSCINSMNKFFYKDEIEENVNNHMKKTNDIIQLKTIKRFLSKKQTRKITNKIHQIKQCPHCAYKENITNYNSSYIICGYANINSNTGYDWKGCGKDWCYDCCKKLCKNWGDDKLYELGNRFHDNLCCMYKATINNEDYINTYCQCSNKYVNRKHNKIDFVEESDNDDITNILSDFDITNILSDIIQKK
jgi:hypothetical protein